MVEVLDLVVRDKCCVSKSMCDDEEGEKRREKSKKFYNVIGCCRSERVS